MSGLCFQGGLYSSEVLLFILPVEEAEGVTEQLCVTTVMAGLVCTPSCGAGKWDAEKSTCTPVTRRFLVPYGLTPEVHSVLAEGIVPPLDQDIDLSDDLEFAVAMTVEQGPAIARWRKRYWMIMEKVFRRLAELNVLWNTDRSQASREVSSHLSIASIMRADIQLIGLTVVWLIQSVKEQTSSKPKAEDADLSGRSLRKRGNAVLSRAGTVRSSLMQSKVKASGGL